MLWILKTDFSVGILNTTLSLLAEQFDASCGRKDSVRSLRTCTSKSFEPLSYHALVTALAGVIDVEQHAAASEFHRDFSGGAATAERIEHQIALPARQRDATAGKLFGERRNMCAPEGL